MDKKVITIFIFIFFLLLVFLITGCARKDASIIIKHTVSSGETLSESLIKNGLSPAGTVRVVRELSRVFDPRNSKVGDYYELTLSTGGSFLSFSYYPQGRVVYEVVVGSEPYIHASKRELPYAQKRRDVAGMVKTSLWEAMRAQGIEPETIVSFAEIFSSQIDFFTETQNGDIFKLIWDEKIVEGKNARKVILDKIIAARYVRAGDKGRRIEDGKEYDSLSPNVYTAIGFGNSELDYDYYSLNGKSLRLAFLRAPLNYRRISSFFSRRRFHPILRRYRPHHGIDYVAPIGTPVSSIGDGTVIFRGRKGGYGKTVKVRHPNGYVSLYGHLSRFAKISRNSRVKKGQVIGYVGSTGSSTGPHLHFELLVNSRPVNFLKLRLPPAKVIPRQFKADFEKRASEVIKELEKLRSSDAQIKTLS